jgi:membrane-bound lytic murein transglycosylase D
MIKKRNSLFKVSKSTWILFFSLAIGSFAKGNPHTDTSKKVLLASVNKNDKAEYIVKEANVVFPEVLSGNEEQSLDYIEKFSANRRAYVVRTYTKGKKFFPKITPVLERHDLPQELKVLIALESAFNGNAVSKAGAVGYWQFMDDVAREYGLKYASFKSTKKTSKKSVGKKGKVKVKAVYVRDDRKNFNKSTLAAARYLRDRGRNLNNDILLMVASYNCGVGNVWNAMERTGLESPSFWDIKKYLPSETRAYVMNFITLNVLFHNYDKFISNTLSFTPTKIKLDDEERDMTEGSAKPVYQK